MQAQARGASFIEQSTSLTRLVQPALTTVSGGEFDWGGTSVKE
jgi:hypothetical protein